MKTIEVVAAIIRKGDKIFATQRGYGEFKDWWEFPGGKMEPGETPEEALIREIHEELDATIRIDKFLYTVDWDYPKFHLTMHCYLSSLVDESLHLNEHEAARWLNKEDIHSVNWLPADEILLPMIVNELDSSENQIINPPRFKVGNTIYWICDEDQSVHHATVLSVNYEIAGNQVHDVNYKVLDECINPAIVRYIDDSIAEEREFPTC